MIGINVKDLFGNDIIERSELSKKLGNKSAVIAHDTLIKMYGKTEGKQCKDCSNCIKTGNSTTYYKCVLFSTSSCLSSDWRAKWDACGKFEITQSL